MGEVDYGGSFPIAKIEHVVHSRLLFCDDKLFQLTSRALNYRREEQVGPGELTYRDVLLYDYIVKERDRLKKLLAT
jgi:hypothetical protein